jgi:peptidoglycan/LPS O-acetylase OafA/YrhL
MANQRTDHSRRNFGLDVLRAAAIGMVLATHLIGPLRFLGVYGVELFFVLSGFLIGDILIRCTTKSHRFSFSDLTSFWRRRWFRTLPNYYWFLFIYAISPSGHHSIERPWQYALFLQNFAWPISDFFSFSWSVTIEEWFYLLFPSVFFVLARNAVGSEVVYRRFLQTTILFLIVPPVLRFTQSYWLPDVNPRMIVVLRLDAIMYGVLLAYTRARYTAAWTVLRRRSWYAGVAGLFLSTIMVGSTTPRVQATTYSLIPMAFSLVLPAFEQWRHSAWRGAHVIKAVSVWSYSMYLCHMLVYNSARDLLHYDQLSGIGRVGVKLFAFCMIVIASGVNYRFFERPMTNLRDRLSRPFSKPKAVTWSSQEIGAVGYRPRCQDSYTQTPAVSIVCQKSTVCDPVPGPDRIE